MKLDLAPYRGKYICVACSGGKDSVALLHYLYSHKEEFSLKLSILNCDHAMRKETSARDSAFVASLAKAYALPLYFYRAESPLKGEAQARAWRVGCYKAAKEEYGFDFLATAHHQDDVAETVLFNLARGAGLKGLCGITEGERNGVHYIRPFLSVSRREIEDYIDKNALSFVSDESNDTNEYTRNKLRHEVLPALDEAVPESSAAIARFSRLAQADEEYFSRRVDEIFVDLQGYGYRILPCDERVIFKRAVLRALEREGVKDYTAQRLEEVFSLQTTKTGKKFVFSGMVALKEGKGVLLCNEASMAPKAEEVPFSAYFEGVKTYGGEPFSINGGEGKSLSFDRTKIPENAVVRFARKGDKFHRFGGGTKSLGDYFTDIKLPTVFRERVPVVAVDGAVYIVGGVEIAEDVKVDASTNKEDISSLSCADYRKL